MDEGGQPGGQGDKAGLQVKNGFYPAPLSPNLGLFSYLGGFTHCQTSEQVHQDNHHEEEEDQEDGIAKDRA